MEENCIFCKIVKGELPAYKIWEDNNYIAILDVYPNIKGQTLVLPKKHTWSDIFDVEDKDAIGLLMATKKVVKLLKKRLGVEKVHLILEGGWVKHLHSKLYPAMGIAGFKESAIDKTVYFKSYEGYTTSMRGPRASDESLKKLQKEITG